MRIMYIKECEQETHRMISSIFLLVTFVTGGLNLPIDDPIRVDLPVYDNPQKDNDEQSQNNFVQIMPHELLMENYPGGSPIDYSAGGFLAQKFGHLESQADFGGPFQPITKLESAVQETEGLGSKALSFKENIQNVVAGLFQPKPLVDTISESEKYGNNGDKFYNAGKALVGGASGVSNLVNTVLEVPSAIFKKITRAATEKLNNLGGKLIGL